MYNASISNMKLTIGVTTYYKSNVEMFKRMILSLLDKESTTEIAYSRELASTFIKNYENKHNIDDIELILPKERIEIIIFIDREDENDNENIKEIILFIKSLDIENTVFRIVKSLTNVRVSVARNAIIQLAHGDFICFRDDDDLSVNINELLNIISKVPDKCKFIEANLLDFGKKWLKCTSTSLLMPSNCIVKRKFLIKNNISFIPDIGNEDAFWRSDIYEKLMNEDGIDNAHMIHKGIYIYPEASNRSNATSINPYDDSIDHYYDREMKDNTYGYSIVSKIFSHESILYDKIPINNVLFRSLNIVSAVNNSYPIIREYMLRHSDKFEIKDYIDLVKNINGEINFWDLNDEKHKKECFQMFCKYSSFSDLYKFSLSIENDNQTNAIQTMNIFYKIYDAYEHFCKFGTINYQQLNEFTFKYICFLYLRGNDKKFINKWKNKIDIESLDKIKKYMSGYFDKIQISDMLLFIHGSYSRKFVKMECIKDNFKYHNTINFIGNHNTTSNDLFKSLESLLKNDLIDLLHAIKFYILSNTIDSYDINPVRRNLGTNMDVLVLLLISPSVLKNSINYDVENDIMHDEKIIVTEEGKNITIMKDNFKFNSLSSLSGGRRCIVKQRNNLFKIFLLLLLCIILLIIIITFLTISGKNNNINLKFT